MTAQELIDRLALLPPEMPIYVWDTNTGDRLDIDPNLPVDVVSDFADINLLETKEP